MSSRHLGFFEKHLEKLLIVLVGVFSLAVLWFYVVGSPYRGEVQTRQGTQQLGPGEVEEMVKGKANELKRVLNDPKNPLPEMNVPPYSRNFMQRQQAPLADPKSSSTPLSEWGIHPKYASFGSDAGRYPVYAIPTPSAPGIPTVRSDHALLSDRIPADRLELYAKLVGHQQPRDFFYVSVKSQIDLKDWAGKLRQAPAPRIPEEWWKNHQLLTYVELQRSELNVRTNQWSDPVTISLLPNYPMRKVDQVPADAPSDQVFSLLARLQSAQYRLAKAEFVPVSSDRPWMPPDIDVSKVTESLRPKLMQTLFDLQDLEARISTVLGLAEELNVPINRPDPANTNEGTSPAGMGPAAVSSGSDSQQLVQLEHQMEELLRRRDLILKGQNPDDVPASGSGGAAVTPSVTGTGTAGSATTAKPAAPASSTITGSVSTLVSHDVTAQPGKTYRYRLVVGLFNPLFRRQQVDIQQKKTSFEQLTVRSEPSAWSQPVTVEPVSRFFFTGADNRGARLELWRLFNGRYQKQMMDAVAGDAIQSVAKFQYMDKPQELAIRVPMALVDIVAADARGGSTKAIFLDRLTGKLEERTIQSDSESLMRKVLLQEEAAVIAAAKAAAGGGQPAATATPEPVRQPINRSNRQTNPEGMPPGMDPTLPPPGGPGAPPRR